MKNLKNSYMGEIKKILKKLSSEDKETIENYTRYRRTTASDLKVKSYINKIIILREIAQKPFSEFNDKKLIEDLLILIKNSDRAESQKNELKKVLKNFLIWKFNDIGFMKSLNTQFKCKDLSKTKIDKQDLPTDKEIKKMFLACKNLQEKAMLTIQEELALRPIELLQCLKWKNIKFEEDRAIVKIEGNKSANSERTLIIKTALPHLLRWKNEFPFEDLRQDDYVFPYFKDRTKPYHKQYLALIYRRLCKRAGIKNINPYSIRHRRITFIWEKTKDLKLTAKFGGHSIKVCQDVYQHSSDNEIADLLMEKVYDIKEPTIEEKNRIEELNKRIEDNKEKLKRVIRTTDYLLQIINHARKKGKFKPEDFEDFEEQFILRKKIKNINFPKEQ